MAKPRPITIDFKYQVGAGVMHQLHVLIQPPLRDKGIIYSRQFSQWKDGETQKQYLVRFVNPQGILSDPVWLHEFQLLPLE